jgi:hypothetical protein
MKLRNTKWRFSMSVIWCAFRDTAIYLFAIVAFGEVHTLFRENHFMAGTTKDFRMITTLFFIVWLANCIAGAFGLSTITDDLGGPESGPAAKAPATLAVTMIVGLISFVVLLLGGFTD